MDSFPGGGVLHPLQFFGQKLIEAAVDFTDRFAAEGVLDPQAASVDPLLDGDVGARLQLEVAFAGVGAVVVLQGAFDVDGVGVVALDEI